VFTSKQTGGDKEGTAAILQPKNDSFPVGRKLRTTVSARQKTSRLRRQTVNFAPSVKAPSSSPAKVITVEDVMQFAVDHAGETFRTLARNNPFDLRPARNGIRIGLASGLYFAVSRKRIAEYLRFYNSAPEAQRGLTAIWPKTMRETSYMVRILAGIRDTERGRARERDNEEFAQAPAKFRNALKLARTGQGPFRDDLLAAQKRCHVTGIEDPRFLVAVRIKPWDASSNQERLDPDNGLLLAPAYAHLFERHLISFGDDGRVMISKTIPAGILATMAIDPAGRGAVPGSKAKHYLAQHRERFLRLKDLRSGHPTLI